MGKHRKGKPGGISVAQLEKVMASDRVIKVLRQKAEQVVKYWQSVSPVFDASDPKEHRQTPPGGEPGAYRNSITALERTDDDGNTIEHIVATDFKAKWIEYGSANMPEYAPLAKTKARFRK